MVSRYYRRRIAVLAVLSFIGLLVAVTVAIYSHSSISIQRLHANPHRYDGKIVSIRGIVTGPQGKVSQRKHGYATFMLCNGPEKVSVFSFGALRVTEGQYVTVQGVYAVSKQIGPWTITDEIDVTYGRVICGRTHADRWRDRISALFK